MFPEDADHLDDMTDIDERVQKKRVWPNQSTYQIK